MNWPVAPLSPRYSGMGVTRGHSGGENKILSNAFLVRYSYIDAKDISKVHKKISKVGSLGLGEKPLGF